MATLAGLSAPKDAVTTMVLASAALTGFTLVFFGLVLAQYQGLFEEAKHAKHAKIGGAIVRVLLGFVLLVFLLSSLAVFVLGILAVSLGVTWLVVGYGYPLYVLTIVAFFAETAALMVVVVTVGWALVTDFPPTT
jgi:hypothetical protein